MLDFFIKDHRKQVKSPLIGLNSNHDLMKTLVQFTIKDGKKDLAVKLINRVIELLEKDEEFKGNENINDKFTLISKRSMIMVGFFKRRIGSRNYRIPYQLNMDRAYRHSIKRLYKLVIKSKSERKFSDSLFKELKFIYLNDKVNSLILSEKSKLYKEAKLSRGLDYLISNFKLKNGQSYKVDPNILTD